MGQESAAQRPRARDIGVPPGILPPGTLNAITDVPGVRVGHVTVWEGESVRTGVTAILPHGGNLFREKVPAAIFIGNGFGKLTGYTQVRELGEIETPILLTCTLCVPRAADALIDTMLGLPGNENVQSINPVVGETNDGFLNDIRSRPIRPEDVRRAIESAREGPVEEGSVGAGTGTVAFGWKGGIGTSSRRLPERLGGYTVGVLVQSNFGGVLQILGAPVGRELGRHFLKDVIGAAEGGAPDAEYGSIMIVVATDAPLSPRNLERLAARAMLGLARTGSPSTNGSGDYVIAFSTSPELRRLADDDRPVRTIPDLRNDALSPLFQAVVEATEEAIYNSLFKATTVRGYQGHVAEALPLPQTLGILRRHGVPVREWRER
ncbi:MAG: P1 family peptidase [Gemmatimonadetes bacterium]|nr:P1 family peptidase [Gemmatimonadota bacterium]